MLASVVSAVMRWVIFDDFNVRNQPYTCVSALDQIMTKKSVLRKTAIQNLMDDIDFINAFAGKNPFAVKILVDVGNCASIDVEAGLARVDVCQP